MINNYVGAERKLYTFYELCFDDGHGNGCGFPCDANGNVSGLIDAAKRNLEYCMAHPEKFRRWNKVVAYKQWYSEPARGTCSCGEEIILTDQYYGACECPSCGKWYNLFGQELQPPERWEDGW